MIGALELPDIPRWVEAHGIARDPSGWRVAVGDGFALGHDAAKLIVIAGPADAAAISELARTYPRYALLIERPEPVTGRRVDRAILHTLADPASLPDLDGATALSPETSLAHLPPALADELARATTPVWAAWVDGQPVSFAYAPWRSAAWFDVSVDTLASARQLGLATIVAAAMIHGERAHGREPVWGADEANAASRALAGRLGFVPADEIWVVAPVEPELAR